jgi:hypothetical protein
VVVVQQQALRQRAGELAWPVLVVAQQVYFPSKALAVAEEEEGEEVHHLPMAWHSSLVVVEAQPSLQLAAAAEELLLQEQWRDVEVGVPILRPQSTSPAAGVVAAGVVRHLRMGSLQASVLDAEAAVHHPLAGVEGERRPLVVVLGWP